MAHHGHPAHPLPAQPLLQHSTDSDKRPGPAQKHREPPVLSRSQPGTGGEAEAERRANMGWGTWLSGKPMPYGVWSPREVVSHRH